MEAIENWKRIRQETIRILNGLADELDRMEKNINIAKITGTGTAILFGAGAVIAGIGAFFTGGILAPAAAALGAGAFAGGATHLGSSLVKYIQDNSNIGDAQKAVDEDAKITEELICFFADMEREVSIIEGSRKADGVNVIGGVAKGAKAANTLAQISSKLGPKVVNLVAAGGSGALTTGGRIFGTIGRISRIAGPILGAVVIPFDIYNLVKTAIAINKGCPNAVAVEFRKHSNCLQREYEEFEKVGDEIKKILDNM